MPDSIYPALFSRSSRTAWDDLPADARAAVAAVVVSPIVNVDPIVDGFSPGLLARLDLANGNRMFVKVSDCALNERPGRMHEQEAKVLCSFGELAPAPRLIGTVTAGNWTGLVTQFVDGHCLERATQFVDALTILESVSQSAPPPNVESLATVLRQDFLWSGLSKLAERDGRLLHGWNADQTSRLLGYERYMPAAVDGDHLVHGDMRADNLLLPINSESGVAVDWPAAAIGNPCFDIVMLCASVAERCGGVSGELLVQSERCRNVDPELITALIVGIYGHYSWASTLGDPPGIPGVRAYQASMAATLDRWLKDRLG